MRTKLIAILALALAYTAPVYGLASDGSGVKTVSGTVAAGAKFVTFIFSSDYTGTIEGVAFSGATGSSWTYPAISTEKYPALTYVITTGTLTVMLVR